MMNNTDHRISKAAMMVRCERCDETRTYFPQAIRHMGMTPQCSCGWRGWRDILGCKVFFGPPAQRQGS